MAEILKEGFLIPLWLGQNTLARAMDVAPRRINESVPGRRAMTSDTDLRLARCLGLSERFFLGTQTDCEMRERKRAFGDALDRIMPRVA